MTISYLETYRNLKKEAQDLKDRLDAVGDVQALRPKLVPGKSDEIHDLSDDIVKRERIRKIWKRKEREAEEALMTIEYYLDTVKDPLVRTAIRKKYIDGHTWEDVGSALHCDRRNLARKVESYVEHHI